MLFKKFAESIFTLCMHFPGEKGPTWWGWEHRRYSGSWRWRAKPPRPPAQTVRCRHELFLEPAVRMLNVRHKGAAVNKWPFKSIRKVLLRQSLPFYFGRIVLFCFCSATTQHWHLLTAIQDSLFALGRCMDGDTGLQSALNVTSHYKEAYLSSLSERLSSWWNVPHSRLLRLHTCPQSSWERNHKAGTVTSSTIEILQLKTQWFTFITVITTICVWLTPLPAASPQVGFSDPGPFSQKRCHATRATGQDAPSMSQKCRPWTEEQQQQLNLYVLASANSHLLKHVWKMLLDDAKRLPIHGKVVERLRFVLVYIAHVLQADVHVLEGNSSRSQHCQIT